MKALLAELKTDRGKKVGLGAILAGLSALFTFAGYEMIRSPAESIFLSYFSASQKPYALALVPIVIAVFIYGYGVMLSFLGPLKSMSLSMLFTFFSFFLFYFWIKNIPSAAIAFAIFIFKESYVVIISEQYWSYINSVLNENEGRIYNGPVAGLGALGSLMGGWFVSRYVSLFKTDMYIVFSGLCLLPALFFFYKAYRKTGEPAPSKEEEGGKKGHVHISLLWENKTVLFIALMIFFTQVVATLFDINFTRFVKEAIANKDLRTAFLGDFWMKVNIASFSMQFILAPLILRRARIKLVLVAVPLIHMATSVFTIVSPGLFSAGLAFLLFKSMDYSIFRAAKETLYIPFSYDTRYRVKQVSDAFTYRFSKGFTSLTLSITDMVGRVSYSIFPWFSFLFSGLWILVASFIKEGKESAQAKVSRVH